MNQDTSADLTLIDGRIYTMDQAKPFVEAVAVKDKRVIKVGSTEEVSYLIGKNTKIVYLEGGTVVPGFIDTHIHLADFGRFLLWMDLSLVNSINKMQVLLGERLDKAAKGKWVVGRGWNENRFFEKQQPTKFDLDVVSSENPVLFYHQNGQIALANSKALELAGITKQTLPPAGGIIDTIPQTGEPTGILRESATDLVWRLVPEPSVDEIAETTSLACKKIVQAGITGIHWLAESSVDVAILKRLLSYGELPFDVYMIMPLSLMGDSTSLEGFSGNAKVGGFEILADGYLASRTAALFEPYHEDSKNSGKLQCTKEELSSSAKNIISKGCQVVIHAMGDKAIDAALKALDSAQPKGRQRVDPAALLNPTLILRLKEQMVVVSVQPMVAASEFSVYDAIEHLGESRARWLYPLKTLISQGVRVCAGSDCPMEPLNPLLGIQSTVTRRFFPEEQLSVDEALQMYTLNAAWASGEEKSKGSIEEGKLANFTVLSQDPHEVMQSKIQDIIVEMTIVNGNIVFSRNA